MPEPILKDVQETSQETPTACIVMQLDTPPCFTRGQDEDSYGGCPSCCTCLCPST
ncbi:MAG: hypothetical protein UV53_C0023G0002 [Candidatus Azambacteria bacterium GW2011_GWE1_42_9]|nr:MAG: hypothetical protein UU33_C0001G0405 [Candidatus Azambacteria bacterium GW2011_GWF1_41_10]KKS49439.1 MAG: hypothetical protein UV14_C0001G0185 [Candidatus Azambacteria bacterium GW2011_GWF2_42_22]KKS73948.1 MAG: hypothetical protein UV45_C0017G0008 [Candidatus Azambacteria bacterium GW2011_GWB1_42_72]KKS78790.1 MAG: hypothetical protein UV53_C0023G0002 [Candidatus Azambacteria bacterium GW2011_GWE1_42_9]KKT03550.1 MAG: hypothetical protein UV81_C0001G0146 [Candidatus Azambacteria bacter